MNKILNNCAPKYFSLTTILPENKGKIIGTCITYDNGSPGKLPWKEITQSEYLSLNIKKNK